MSGDEEHLGVKEHREEAKHRLGRGFGAGFALLTVSSSRARHNDRSGRLMKETLTGAGHRVIRQELVADDRAEILKIVHRLLAEPEVDVLLTSGGTGIGPKDVTVETLEPLLEKILPGFGELFRALSYQEIGTAAIMSRALAGCIGNKLVFCLPGSPSGVKLALEKIILPELKHLIFHLREKNKNPTSV